MSETFTKAEELAGHVKEYVHVKIESAKLNVAEKTSGVIANLAAGLVILLVFILFLFFAGISGAIALSGWIGKPFSGYLIVAGIFLLTGIIVWAMKTRIIQIPVMNSIIHQLFKKEPDENN